MKELAYSIFRPDKEVKGALLIVHGMAEHRTRYDAFARYLSEMGWGVVTYDLPGHGDSADPADKGWFGKENGWDTLENSAVDMMMRTKKEFPGVPFVLMGHSMGTIISRCVLQKHDAELDGLILSGAPNYQSAVPAGIRLAKVIRTFKGAKGHSKFLDQMVTGNFNKAVQNPRTSVDWLSFSQENVDRYIADPDCGFPFTIQGYIDELTGMVHMHDQSRFHVTKPDLPIYLFAGEYDPCRGGEEGWKDSIGTIKEAGYQNVQTKLWPNMRHETLNEKDRELVFADVAAWLAHAVKHA